MAEVEVGGVKFTGGKMFAVITALSTLGGVAWGAFEFYNDYRNMKEQISEYVAPDLSGINERISVMEEQVVNAVDNTRTIKLDLKRDIQNIETQVDRVEKIVKDTQDGEKGNHIAPGRRLKPMGAGGMFLQFFLGYLTICVAQ